MKWLATYSHGWMGASLRGWLSSSSSHSHAGITTWQQSIRLCAIKLFRHITRWIGTRWTETYTLVVTSQNSICYAAFSQKPVIRFLTTDHIDNGVLPRDSYQRVYPYPELNTGFIWVSRIRLCGSGQLHIFWLPHLIVSLQSQRLSIADLLTLSTIYTIMPVLTGCPCALMKWRKRAVA